MKKAEIVLGVAVVAAVGVLIYSYMSSRTTAAALPSGGGLGGGLGGGGGGGALPSPVASSGDPIFASSGGRLTTGKTQALLKSLGNAFKETTMANVPTTGHLDAGTLAAIKDFQSIKGIKVDGIVGPQTADTLGQTYISTFGVEGF